MRPTLYPLLVVLLTSLLLSACAFMSRPPLERRHFLVQIERGAIQCERAPLDMTLALRPLRVASEFDAKAFITFREGGRVEADFRHHFFLPPGEMLTGLVQQWLDQAEVFAHVTNLSSFKAPDLILEGFVPILARKSPDGKPKAVLSMQFLLLRPDKGAGMQAVLQRDYLEEIDLRDSSPQELIRGWNQALTRILSAFETDLRTALNAPCPEMNRGEEAS